MVFCRECLGVLVALGLLVLPARAEEPPTWFRADQGVARDDALALPVDLASPAALVWRTPLGAGHSTPAVHGDRVYVTAYDQEQLLTVALDRATGKELWRRAAPYEKLEAFHATGSPAAATPACDGERVYVFFGSYGLLCYDRAGNVVWKRPLGPFQDEFGAASSPVLAGELLLLNSDHDRDNWLLAVDRRTGQTVWQTPRDGFTRSYSTPIVWDSGSERQVLVAGALELVAYELATGAERWRLSGLARIVNTTPIVSEGRLFVATWSPGGDTTARIAMEPWATAVAQWDKNGDARLSREEANNPEVLDRFYRIDLDQNTLLDQSEWEKYARVFELAQNALLCVRPGGAGDVTGSAIVWRERRNLPYVPSPLAYRGVLYLVKNGGICSSFDPATGKLLKQGRLGGASDYYASPVAGDGKLYFVSERGEVTVVAAGPEWQVLAAHDLAERTMASPVVDAGTLYLRTEQAVYAFRRP